VNIWIASFSTAARWSPPGTGQLLALLNGYAQGSYPPFFVSLENVEAFKDKLPPLVPSSFDSGNLPFFLSPLGILVATNRTSRPQRLFATNRSYRNLETEHLIVSVVPHT
jgi:hypothetical protein